MRLKSCLIFLFIVLSIGVFAQKDSSSVNSKKLALNLGVQVSTLGVSTLVMNELWYKPYSTGKFHFFNDNQQWLQIDKMGHAFTAYHLSKAGAGLYRYSGFSEMNCVLLGPTYSFTGLLLMEILDGYSSGWGFSWGDIAANTLGSGLFIAKHLISKNAALEFKFGYTKSAYYNDSENFANNLLKDYNGQTYWLSYSPFQHFKNTQYLRWLGISLGMGGTQMVHGTPSLNPNDPNFHIREYYLSIDFLPNQLNIKNVWLKRVANVFNVIKFPAPTLRLSNGKLGGAWLFI